jgi:hypothetical protein
MRTLSCAIVVESGGAKSPAATLPLSHLIIFLFCSLPLNFSVQLPACVYRYRYCRALTSFRLIALSCAFLVRHHLRHSLAPPRVPHSSTVLFVDKDKAPLVLCMFATDRLCVHVTGCHPLAVPPRR